MTRLTLIAGACSLLIQMAGCGTPEPAVADACTAQLTVDDCELIGNNVLSFTKGMENYECAWTDNACVLRQK